MRRRIAFLRFFFTALCYSLFFVSKSFAYEIKLYPKDASFQSASALKLVFCAYNYQEYGELSKDMDLIINRLKQTIPFNEFPESIEFWQIRLDKEEEKKFFKPGENLPPIQIEKDFLKDIFKYLQANYKLVIIDASSSLSCAELSSIDATSQIILGKQRYKDGESFAKGFLHELGHSLGLRDECVSCAQLSSAGKPNCAFSKEEAQEWWGDLLSDRVNYINGCCGNKSYIRPTIASLMNNPDQAGDFGPVNERYLRQALSKN